MRPSALPILLASSLALGGARAQTVVASGAPAAAAPTVAFAALADSVAGRGATVERVTRLVHWINDGFTWSATDYVRRSPVEIVARREGNCADLARVLHTLLDSLDIRSRWVREINVQPAPTPRRQATAAEKVAAAGNGMSVFGLQHNDHVWLEVWDDARQRWFPADPAYGVVGEAEWLAARLALADRPRPRVDAVVPIAADMYAPFVVLAQSRLGREFDDDRTEHYLVDGFASLYRGRLAALPAWAEWTSAVRALAPHARAAFEGRENLHAQTDAIRRLKEIYAALAAQAAERGVSWR